MRNENNNFGLTKAQIAGIKQSKKIAEQLVNDIPEIADDYRRRGYSALEIVEEYEINAIYGVTKNTAKSAVYYALPRLIPQQELERIAQEHLIANAFANCIEKKALFSLSKEELRELGCRSYEEKKGVHGMSKEKLRLAVIKSHIARGNVPWSDEEKEFVLSRARDPKYITYKGRNLDLIKKEYDENFSNERTRSSIQIFITKAKKQGLID